MPKVEKIREELREEREKYKMNYEIDINVSLSSCLVGEESKKEESKKDTVLKSYTSYLWLKTGKRRAIIRLTDKIREIVKRSGIKEGFVLVSAMHITAAIYVNDDEEGIMCDMMDVLDWIAPFEPEWYHHNTGEDNADAHLKSLLLHHQVVVPLTEGDLDLGPWQEIFYAEFDGKRKKRIIVKVLGF